jgi:LPXTG-site transpeptidase (sortase) family protein
MSDVVRLHPRSFVVRALAGAIALVVAIGSGAVAASAFPHEAVLPPPPPAPVLPDFDPAGAGAVGLVRGLTAPLPVPDKPPTNPRAATPAVQHGQLEIPSIGLSQPFFEGVTLTAIDRGPSHWPGSAMPGQLGNVVIAGHRTTRTRPFWDLDLVKPGDELIFSMTNGDRFVYKLDRIEIVPADAIRIVDQGYGYTATLFGCHPKGSARQRVVGHFTLASVTHAAEGTTTSVPTPTTTPPPAP